MTCESRKIAGQTTEQRRAEITRVFAEIRAAIMTGKARIIVGKQGGIAFVLPGIDRAGVSDACIYRVLMRENAWGFREALAKAETLAGCVVNETMIATGLHSHDHGVTWSKH